MLTEEQQIFEQIKKAKSILITFSKDWNGDAISSALALYLYLKKLDKNVDIVAQKIKVKDSEILESPNKFFSFLPSFYEIKNALDNLRKFVISLNIKNTKVNQIKYKLEKDLLNFIVSPKDGFFTHDDISSHTSGFKYDLIIILDTTDLESLGNIYDNDTEFFYKTPIINIDHCAENEEYGQINYINLNSISTSEILFDLLKKYSEVEIDSEIATCLLTGMIYKTKSFKTSNITPQTLMTTSELISMGARREEIVNHLYRSRKFSVLKLWGKVLTGLSEELDNKLIWASLTKDDFIDSGSAPQDLNDVVDELIVNIPQAKIITLIYEGLPKISGEENKELTYRTNVLVYSIRSIDSLGLIKEYAPTGTKRLAQATINKPLNIVKKEIIESIKNKLKKLPL